MNNEFLEYITNNEDILYAYCLPPELYNLQSGLTKYVLITKEAYEIPHKYKDLYIIHFPIQLYFKYITNCDITAWVLACLNKKYILKEHVKIPISCNLSKLRKNIDTEVECFKALLDDNATIDDYKAVYTKLYKYIVFANQIVDNHKIINYKILGSGLTKIQNTDDILNTVTMVFMPEYLKFFQKTNSIWLRDLLKKFEKKHGK